MSPAASAGNGAVKPEGPVLEVISTLHFNCASLDKVARGVDPAVVQLHGDILGLDLSEMHPGAHAHFGADGKRPSLRCRVGALELTSANLTAHRKVDRHPQKGTWNSAQEALISDDPLPS